MKYRELSNENIAELLEQNEIFLKESRCSEKDILACNLMLEESMLKFQDRFSEKTEFSCNRIKHTRSVNITVAFRVSEPYNPLEDNEESSGMMNSILSVMGLAPFWSFQNGQNILAVNVKKKKRFSTIQSLLLTILVAVVFSFLCMLLPTEIRDFLSGKILSPLFDAFMRVLSCVAGPLICLSVIWGIYGIGDVSTLEFIGKRMIKRFLAGLSLSTLIALGVSLPFFRLSAGSAGAFDFSSLFNIVLDIIPSDIISPLLNNNTLQIIFLAFAIGLTALILGKKTTVFTQFIEQANYIVQLIMDFISSLISVFIFLSIVTMILSGDMSNFGDVYRIIPIVLLCSAVSMLLHFTAVCIFRKVSPKTLIRKMIPTFIIALSTASSAAAFSSNVTACEKMGIEKKIVNFGIPLGQVVYAIGTSTSFLVIGLCMADAFAVPITPQWLLTLFICTVVLAIATPPIPGGSLACFTVFALQLGLPNEAVSLCVTINILTDFIGTSVNLFCLQCNLIGLSKSFDMLDEKKLRANIK